MKSSPFARLVSIIAALLVPFLGLGCGGPPAEVGVNPETAAPASKAPEVANPERKTEAMPSPGPGIRSIIPAAGPVRGLAFTPDGASLVVADNQGIAVWDVASGRQSRMMADQPTPLSSVAILADASKLAAASYRDEPFAGLVRLGNPADGATRALFEHPRAIDALALSADGTTLAAGTEQATPGTGGGHAGATLLLDATTGAIRATLGEHSHAVNQLAMAPDGSRLATVASRPGPGLRTIGEMIVWDVPTAQVVSKPADELGPIRAVAFAPDGQTLAMAGETARDEPMLVLLDPATCQARRSLTIAPEKADALAFSPDGRTLAVGRTDRRVVLFDVNTGEARALGERHRGPIRSLAFTADGKVLASGGQDRAVVLWALDEK
jgi:WD40 repeat protein